MKKIFSVLLSIFPFIIVFFGSLYTPTDPDLGWHLKYGEYFFKTGQILRDNIYSVMMANHRWANTSWGTDLISYTTYNLGGFFALTILSALVVSLTFYFFSKAAKLTIWDQIFLFPLLLYLEYPINSVSFRGQQISLMFLGIMFYIISLYEKRRRILYLMIPVFLLWVNLHGEFLLGLVMFFGWVLVFTTQKLLTDFDRKFVFQSIRKNLVKNKKEFVSIISILIGSFLITLINPFGLHIHIDALSHIASPLLKNIAEYLPFPSLSNVWWNQVVVAVFLGIGLVYLFFKEKFSTQIASLFAILLLYILSFSVMRYAWPAYYLILPILKPIPGFFKPDSKKATTITSIALMCIILVIILFDKLPITKFQEFNWGEYCRDQLMLCSPKSAEYIKRNKLSKNLYSLYGWGGYLIWNYPEIKPTIDGRMHMWRDEKGYSGFEEYYSIEQNIKDIEKTKYNVVYMSPTKPVYNRLMELVSIGKWKIAYKDESSSVFVRNTKK